MATDWVYMSASERTDELRVGGWLLGAGTLVLGVAAVAIAASQQRQTRHGVRQDARLTEVERAIADLQRKSYNYVSQLDRRDDRDLLDTVLQRVYRPEELIPVYTNLVPRAYDPNAPRSERWDWPGSQ